MEGTRVNIDDLINKYNSYKSSDAKAKYLSSTIKVQEYMPFEVVCVYADNIIKASCYDKDGNIHIDSCKKYLMYIFVILQAYTNLEVHEEKWMLEYNKLARVGLIEAIVKLVPEGEIDTLDAVLRMKSEDFNTNEFSAQAFYNRQLLKLYPFVGKAMDLITSFGEDFLKRVDVDEVKKLLTEQNTEETK